MKTESLLQALEILEKAPATSEEILNQFKVRGQFYTKRTIQRDLEQLLHAGTIHVNRARPPLHWVTESERYIQDVLSLMAKLALEKAGNEIYGSIDAKTLGTELRDLKQPAGFFTELYHCVRESREIEFHYRPQTRETFERAAEKLRSAVETGSDSGMYRVRHLPRYLVFRGAHALILGETFQDEFADDKWIARDVREVRQYELKGIHALKTGACVLRSLDVHPDKVYRDSLQVWTGGRIYVVEIAQFDPLLEKIEKRYSKKVNGENEIIAMLSAGMGRLRLVNPPDEIVGYAQRNGLASEKLFLWEEKG